MEVEIERFSKKGSGVALLETGSKVEVRCAVPGDRLDVMLGKKRRGVARGLLQQIIYPSPDRVAPKCVHVPDCGGCVWQQMDYNAQLQYKQAIVEKIFSFSACPVQPIIPCAHPWEYRNKMEFSFSQNKAGVRSLGLIRGGTKGGVFNLQECWLMPPWVAGLVGQIRTWWEESGLMAYYMPRDEGSLRTLVVREGKRTQDKMIMLTVSGNAAFALTKQQIESYVACVKMALPDEKNLSVFLRVQQQQKGSPTQFYEMHLSGPDHIKEILYIDGKPLKFKISPTSFFQPNSMQAEVLYTTALKMASQSPKELIYDLYCGTASLGMALSGGAKKVIGIELNPYALYDAQSNLEENHISNVELIKGDVGEKLAALALTPDLVVIDPPRPGLSEEALKLLINCKPKEILYISCNPATQAENIKILCLAGYQLLAVQPVDQFPHTLHIENISYLVFA